MRAAEYQIAGVTLDVIGLEASVMERSGFTRMEDAYKSRDDGRDPLVVGYAPYLVYPCENTDRGGGEPTVTRCSRSFDVSVAVIHQSYKH